MVNIEDQLDDMATGNNNKLLVYASTIPSVIC